MEWLKIGEVARRTGLTHRTLRHYDDLGLLVPSGRSGGDYRLYAPEDLERLLSIQHLKSLGMGLEEIARALDDPGFDAGEALARHAALVEGRIAAEQDLLDRLRRLQAASGSWEEVLDTIALTERLRHPDAWVRFRAALRLGEPMVLTAEDGDGHCVTVTGVAPEAARSRLRSPGRRLGRAFSQCHRVAQRQAQNPTR